jgi:hypothetical protein
MTTVITTLQELHQSMQGGSCGKRGGGDEETDEDTLPLPLQFQHLVQQSQVSKFVSRYFGSNKIKSASLNTFTYLPGQQPILNVQFAL